MVVAVQAEGLTKVYHGGVVAVEDIRFQVGRGEIFGFLGPNGAGKSTTIMMLITLLRPTSGTAKVCGIDVVQKPDAVRRKVGYVSQDIAVDETLTGRQNLFLQGKLYHVPSSELKHRVDEMIHMVGLRDRADHLVSTYSGGMRKRLDIAGGLVHQPEVLFLDEPTLGLDIQTRRVIWDYVLRLREEHEITIFLTTHYMEEADRLCDRVAIIHNGRIATTGTPAELKASIAGARIDLELEGYEGGPVAGAIVEELSSLPLVERLLPGKDGQLALMVWDGEKAAPRVLEFLGSKGLRVRGLSMKPPSLDDVFLHFTGRALREDEGASAYYRTRIALRRARR